MKKDFQQKDINMEEKPDNVLNEEKEIPDPNKEDQETEESIERNLEQIKLAAENWLKTQEEKLEKRLSSRLINYSEIVAVSFALTKLTVESGKVDLVTLAVVAGIGGALGHLAAKLRNYLDRRKFNNQEKQIKKKMGEPTTFKEVKNSFDELNK